MEPRDRRRDEILRRRILEVQATWDDSTRLQREIGRQPEAPGRVVTMWVKRLRRVHVHTARLHHRRCGRDCDEVEKSYEGRYD